MSISQLQITCVDKAYDTAGGDCLRHLGTCQNSKRMEIVQTFDSIVPIISVSSGGATGQTTVT